MELPDEQTDMAEKAEALIASNEARIAQCIQEMKMILVALAPYMGQLGLKFGESTGLRFNFENGQVVLRAPLGKHSLPGGGRDQFASGDRNSHRWTLYTRVYGRQEGDFLFDKPEYRSCREVERVYLAFMAGLTSYFSQLITENSERDTTVADARHALCAVVCEEKQ